MPGRHLLRCNHCFHGSSGFSVFTLFCLSNWLKFSTILCSNRYFTNVSGELCGEGETMGGCITKNRLKIDEATTIVAAPLLALTHVSLLSNEAVRLLQRRQQSVLRPRQTNGEFGQYLSDFFEDV